MQKMIVGALGLISGLATTALALADGQNQNQNQNQNQYQSIIPRDSVAFGKTYGEWAAAWQQWSLSIPASKHPLFDNGDCSTGQKGLDGKTGPVFFLGGKYCATNNPSCSPGAGKRACSVPIGTALFFPVVNTADTVLEEGNIGSFSPECNPTNSNPAPPTTINCLRQAAQDVIDPTTNLSVSIDGATIPNQVLKTNFRVQSPVFSFTLPDANDNLLRAIGEGPFTRCSLAPAGVDGSCFVAVDDGVYVMLSPLSPGKHLLHFTGTFPQFSNFVIDITYYLTVQ